MPAARVFPWTQEEVRALVDYSPETGKFSRDGRQVGFKRQDGRWVVTLKGTQWLASRLAWFWMTGEQVPKNLSIDHINRDKSDDRFENLRLLTAQEQVMNRDCVEFKGGYWWKEEKQRWQVRCTKSGLGKDGKGRKTINFGEFTCEERAKAAAAIMKEEMRHRMTLENSAHHGPSNP